MKKIFLLAVSIFIALMLPAQVSKPAKVNPGSLTSTRDTAKNKAAKITTKDKIDAPAPITLPKNREVLTELENSVHGDPQMAANYINRPSTSQELNSLTGGDRILAGKLLTELENKLMSGIVTNPKTPAQPPMNTGINDQNAGLLEKVRNLNRLMAMNNGDWIGNNNVPFEFTRPGNAHLRPEQHVEFNRVEMEQQTITEMENYRNEIIGRLIREEYDRVINDHTQDVPANNIGGISKLAKYKTLRDLLQEQINRRNKPISINPGSPQTPMVSPIDLDNIVQHLELKIREEEQRAEMFARQRMEIEMRMEQERQNQQLNK